MVEGAVAERRETEGKIQKEGESGGEEREGKRG